MNDLIKYASSTGGILTTLLLLVSVMGSGCGGEIEEAIDDFDSRATCSDYCAKRFDCADDEPTDAETESCVNACRNSIEDNCGNEHQAAANDRIDECVDQACGDFVACMVFDAAPECFGFAE